MGKIQRFNKLILLTALLHLCLFSFSQVTQQWVARYDGPSITDNESRVIITDAAGNIYVAGITALGDEESEYAVIKYDPAGKVLWAKQRRFARYAQDRPYAIALDANGNVYVTGSTFYYEGSEYETIKYDAAGNELWTRKYQFFDPDYPEVSSAYGRDIVTDKEGNAYVTGSRATIKYDTNGNELWIVNRSGESIIIDKLGNIYTGSYSLIKYNAAGDILWEKEAAWAYNITADEAGNIYSAGNETVKKFDAAGNELWSSQTLNLEAKAIAVDALANVYVSGTYNNGSNKDYRTIKYDTNGNLLWTKTYNGDANMDDKVNSMVIDQWGNVYVTGKSFVADGLVKVVTIKYSTSGNQLWLEIQDTYNSIFYGFPSIAVDMNGNPTVADKSVAKDFEADIQVTKYATTGSLLWNDKYAGKGVSQDFANALTVDKEGNIYVTGGTREFNSYISKSATAKYDATGKQLWNARFSNPDYQTSTLNKYDEATDIATDTKGNIIITGTSYTGAYFYPGGATVKYNANGEELWHKISVTGYLVKTAVDANDNIYVTGATTIKYDAAGKKLWEVNYNEQFYNNNTKDMALDAEGNVYVLRSEDNDIGNRDYITIKYDTYGAELWTKHYTPENPYNFPQAIEVDAQGNAFVTGDGVTLKYNTNGDKVWATKFAGVMQDIKTDAKDNIYTTGYKNDSYLTIKYNSNGSILWSKAYIKPDDIHSYARSLSVDENGNIYVTGTSYNAKNYTDYVTVKYDSNGNLLWTQTYNGTENGYDEAAELTLDANDNVIVTGSSQGTNFGYDFTTIKYVQTQPDVPALTIDAGSDKTVIYGYGSNCATLSATVEGGLAPYTYKWANNSSTTSTANVCPTATTTYTVTVTDANGATATDEVMVNVTDVRCGNKGDKVMICHNGKTECIAASAVSAHLKHGDKLGSCGTLSEITQANGNALDNSESANIFKASNTPNPFVTSTNIQYSLPFDGRVQINVFDVLGREVNKLVDAQQKAGNYITSFQANSKGIYYYRITLTTPNKTYQQRGKMIRE